MSVRTFVSFEADDAAFPPDPDEPPAGRELAHWVSETLARAGLEHDGPEEREGWAWELRTPRAKVRVFTIVGLTDDPPVQWQIHTYGEVSLLSRLSSAAAEERQQALRAWCGAIDAALKGDERFREIRWYDQETFRRDHGQSWDASPT